MWIGSHGEFLGNFQIGLVDVFVSVDVLEQIEKNLSVRQAPVFGDVIWSDSELEVPVSGFGEGLPFDLFGLDKGVVEIEKNGFDHEITFGRQERRGSQI